MGCMLDIIIGVHILKYFFVNSVVKILPVLFMSILFLTCDDPVSPYDACGVLNGDNSCVDCNGVVNGGAFVGCSGECDNSEEDMCGVCDTDSSNDCVQDVCGNWGGTWSYVPSYTVSEVGYYIDANCYVEGSLSWSCLYSGVNWYCNCDGDSWQNTGYNYDTGYNNYTCGN